MQTAPKCHTVQTKVLCPLPSCEQIRVRSQGSKRVILTGQGERKPNSARGVNKAQGWSVVGGFAVDEGGRRAGILYPKYNARFTVTSGRFTTANAIVNGGSSLNAICPIITNRGSPTKLPGKTQRHVRTLHNTNISIDYLFTVRKTRNNRCVTSGGSKGLAVLSSGSPVFNDVVTRNAIPGGQLFHQ